MVDGQAYRQFNKIAQKWRDLAEKRRAHYLELYRTGRWKLYYSEAEFVLRMREVSGIAETWAGLVDPAAINETEDGAVLPPQQTAA